MTEPRQERCDTCKFREVFNYEVKNGPVLRDYIECHRYPPPPMTDSFPRVDPIDWCGEYVEGGHD